MNATPFPFNFHGHTQFCDGQLSPEDHAQAAIRLGFTHLGLSSHCPVPFASTWNMPPERLGEYLRLAREAQARHAPELDLWVGLEVDFVDGQDMEALYAPVLDYRVGGVHFLKTFPQDGEHWDLDRSPAHFERGLRAIFGHDIRALATYYFEQVMHMVEATGCQIVAHLDLIKKFNRGNRYFREDEPWYQALVEACLQRMAAGDKLLEVNTRGLYSQLCDDFFPSRWVIRRAVELGVPLTVNSDAHHPSELAKAYPQAHQALREAGCPQVFHLNRQGWKSLPLG